MWYLKEMQRINYENVASFSQGKVKVKDIPIMNTLKVKIESKALSYKCRHYLHQAIFRISVSSFL